MTQHGGRLQLWCVADDTDAPVTALTATLSELPIYMRPAVLRRVDRLPRNANGKVDRGALIELDATAVAGPPADPTATSGEIG